MSPALIPTQKSPCEPSSSAQDGTMLSSSISSVTCDSPAHKGGVKTEFAARADSTALNTRLSVRLAVLPVADDVDHVVDAPGDPVIAVGIAPAAVAGEVFAGIGLEVRIDEALVIAIDRAHHSRPGIDDAEVAGRGALEHLAFTVDDLWNDAEKRLRGRARPEARAA